MKVKQLLIAVFITFTLVFTAAYAAPVNINTADAATISKSLKGVGKVKAEAIVAYRDMNGNFKSADDLVKVKGIGKKTLADNRDDIKVSD